MKIITDRFISVVASDGYKLTTYLETEDIKNFDCFTRGAFPLTYDTSKLREISIEEAERLEEAKQKAIEETEETE